MLLENNRMGIPLLISSLAYLYNWTCLLLGLLVYCFASPFKTYWFTFA